MKQVQCPYCHKQLARARTYMHESVCKDNPSSYKYPKKLVPCKWCGIKVSRSKLDYHIGHQCVKNPSRAKRLCKQCGIKLVFKDTRDFKFKKFCSVSCSQKYNCKKIRNQPIKLKNKMARYHTTMAKKKRIAASRGLQTIDLIDNKQKLYNLFHQQAIFRFQWLIEKYKRKKKFLLGQNFSDYYIPDLNLAIVVNDKRRTTLSQIQNEVIKKINSRGLEYLLIDIKTPKHQLVKKINRIYETKGYSINERLQSGPSQFEWAI